MVLVFTLSGVLLGGEMFTRYLSKRCAYVSTITKAKYDVFPKLGFDKGGGCCG